VAHPARGRAPAGQDVPVTSRIEDYALVGDCHTAALVGRDGSVDWMCLPRYDSPAAFAALLGTPADGRWSLAPVGPVRAVQRSYVGDSFVLSTRWVLDDGVVEVVDAMPVGDRRADLVRRVVGVEGTVRMRQELVIRFSYGEVVPWVRRVDGQDDALLASAGPDAVLLRSSVELPQASGRRHVGEFTVAAGETADLVLTWYPSHREPPPPSAAAWAPRGAGGRTGPTGATAAVPTPRR
jgi:GH15 family glucan-1,4-alpha-glucosidase